MPFSIFIVDDEPKICLTLSEILQKRGYRTLSCTDPREVLPTLKDNAVDLLLIDVRLPHQDGLQLLRSIRAERGQLPVIMISGHATVETVVAAMKCGALNFYTKPINNQRLIEEIGQLASAQTRAAWPDSGASIVTRDPAMLRVLELARKAAPTDATVTITGESGTGKELVADLLHQRSPRRNRPLVKINCASIPEPLLESEMFGHEKGAFTDARAVKQGQFELAGEGSLFLDEIGDMSLPVQSKMLRVLQDKCFSRIGGSAVLKADCRIIAATNKDLLDLIARGLLREDLYYRLSVITLQLPPLRERKQDIPLLVEHFLGEFNRSYGKSVRRLSPEIRAMLQAHDWPGNVRELRNFLERAVIFCEGECVEPASIPEHYRGLARAALLRAGAAAGDPAGEALRDEAGAAAGDAPLAVRYRSSAREIILEALERSRGIKQKAAELLHIDRKTLYRKMKKYHIPT